MTRDDIYLMAKEAGFMTLFINEDTWIPYLEKFAKLVAAEEREKWKWEGLHTCHPHCDRPACIAVRRAREDEREMCAKVCMDKWMEWMDASPDKRLDMRNDAEDCAFAIRERGAP